MAATPIGNEEIKILFKEWDNERVVFSTGVNLFKMNL